MARPLHVAVLTCGAHGYETAADLARLSCVRRVTVVESENLRPRGTWRRLRLAYSRKGPWGLAVAVMRKVRPPAPERASPPDDYLRVRRFHDTDGLAALQALGADLYVVDGTYILPESVFGIPELGTINLHCGYLPDVKGAPPVFWELYEGKASTGVSVHFVTADLDGGPIIARRRIGIDPAPSGDPVEYADRIWREVLRREGIEMLAEAVGSLAKGQVETIHQSTGEGRVYLHPDYRTVRALRRRVARRRKAPHLERED